MSGTCLEQAQDPATGAMVWRLTLTEADATFWDRERLDMIEDAMFLIRRALISDTKGPLTLPRTGIPVR